MKKGGSEHEVKRYEEMIGFVFFSMHDSFLLPELCVVTVRTVKRPTEILAGT